MEHTDASDDSDDENESVEWTAGGDPGKVLSTHLTLPLSLPLSPSLSLQSCCILLCAFAGTLRSCFMLWYAFAGSIHHDHGQMPHYCTHNSETCVLVQGAEADETDPPSARTVSPSAEADKIVPSDKPDPPSPQSPSNRRALSQSALRTGSGHCSLYPLHLRNLRYHRGASPCTLRAHCAHYAHFSTMAKPPKIEL
jgi:hypothetical protein